MNLKICKRLRKLAKTFKAGNAVKVDYNVGRASFIPGPVVGLHPGATFLGQVTLAQTCERYVYKQIKKMHRAGQAIPVV